MLAPNPTCAAMSVKTVCSRWRSWYIGQEKTSSQWPIWLHDCEPGLGPGDLKFTRRDGSTTGSGRSSIWSISEKIAALAPMPSASEAIGHRR